MEFKILLGEGGEGAIKLSNFSLLFKLNGIMSFDFNLSFFMTLNIVK